MKMPSKKVIWWSVSGFGGAIILALAVVGAVLLLKPKYEYRSVTPMWTLGFGNKDLKPERNHHLEVEIIGSWIKAGWTVDYVSEGFVRLRR